MQRILSTIVASSLLLVSTVVFAGTFGGNPPDAVIALDPPAGTTLTQATVTLDQIVMTTCDATRVETYTVDAEVDLSGVGVTLEDLIDDDEWCTAELEWGSDMRLIGTNGVGNFDYTQNVQDKTISLSEQSASPAHWGGTTGVDWVFAFDLFEV